MLSTLTLLLMVAQAVDVAAPSSCRADVGTVLTSSQHCSDSTGADGMDSGKVEAKRQICFDFTKGTCTRGEACKFSHDIKRIIEVNSQERGICFDFLRHACSRGALCRFSHDLSNFDPQDGQVRSTLRAPAQISPGIARVPSAALTLST